MGISTDNENNKRDMKDLRDYFAGKALQGVMSNMKMVEGITEDDELTIPLFCYTLADSMLKERLKNIEVYNEEYVTTRTDG